MSGSPGDRDGALVDQPGTNGLAGRIMNEPFSSRDQTLLAAILDSAIDFAIIALDPDNKVTLWNPGAEKILGWTAEEIMGGGRGGTYKGDSQRPRRR